MVRKTAASRVWQKGLTLSVCLFASHNASIGDETERMAFFEKRIRPVLIQSCFECHSAESEPPKGGCVLTVETPFDWVAIKARWWCLVILGKAC